MITNGLKQDHLESNHWITVYGRMHALDQSKHGMGIVRTLRPMGTRLILPKGAQDNEASAYIHRIESWQYTARMDGSLLLVTPQCIYGSWIQTACVLFLSVKKLCSAWRALAICLFQEIRIVRHSFIESGDSGHWVQARSLWPELFGLPPWRLVVVVG